MLFRRAAALVVALTLATAGWAECAGWQGTPETRLACCSEMGDCPMHPSGSKGTGASQAEADRCCVASERHDSAPSAVAFAAATVLALVPSDVSPVELPEVVQAAATHTLAPLPRCTVRTHLLLSVFLL
jgi:hypothetical protein